MRLVIDLQGAQGSNRARGIGRYSRELALSMARHAGTHDVIIALNGRLAPEEIRHDFADVLPRENIRVWHGPGGTAEAVSSSAARRRAAEAMRAEFLMSMRPDLLHVSSIFEGWSDDAVTVWPTWLRRPLVIATGYDLIPLIRREEYLDGAWKQSGLSQWYQRCLQELRLADAILAISRSSHNEMVHYLGIDLRDVCNIRAGVGAEFKPPHLDSVAHHDLLHRLGLRSDYILFLGGGDIRKNEGGLIRAYGLLPKTLRGKHQLVIVGKCDNEALRSTAREAGIEPSELNLIHFVNAVDLPGLYASCALFVLPSLHEGFGLPAAEAMACGAPVIASNTTSLPEVVGRTDTLFNPTDPAAIADRMLAVLEDRAFRRELVSHSLRQAATFTWRNSAIRAWRHLEAIHARVGHFSPAVTLPGWRPSLAYSSPLPPQPTGIADYSAELIPALARYYDITVIADGAGTNHESLVPNFPVITPARFLAEADRFDRVLYHIGNSAFHADQLENLLPKVPGIVTLHDVFLSGVCNWSAHHGNRGGAGFTEDIYRSHGWPAVLRERRDGVHIAMRDFPCALPVLQGAMGVIQHSRHGCEMLAAHFGRRAIQDVRIIPHLRQRFGGPEREVARKRLGISENKYLVCSFGYVSPHKLPMRLFAAWQEADFATEDAQLVFVGQTDDAGAEILKKGEAALGQPVRRFWTDYVDTVAYRTWLAAADVAVQLRAESRGETSGAILDCMAAGVAVVVNDQGSASELPTNAVIRLPAGFSDAMLAETLRLLRDPVRREALVTQALQHVANNLSPRRIAAEYHAVIEAAYTDGNSASRHRVSQSLAYALPWDGNGLETLAACARAVVRSFPAVRPPTLLIEASACPVLRQSDPFGAIVTELLSTHAADVRVDLVGMRQGGWYYERAKAATLLGLPEAPAPDEPADLVDVATLLCLVSPEGCHEAELDRLRELCDTGVALAVIFAESPLTSVQVAVAGLAEQVFCLDVVDADPIDACLANRFPERARSVMVARSAKALTDALL
jgi:glycosyltransferase involved in cell wall biosynthesis